MGQHDSKTQIMAMFREMRDAIVTLFTGEKPSAAARETPKRRRVPHMGSDNINWDTEKFEQNGTFLLRDRETGWYHALTSTWPLVQSIAPDAKDAIVDPQDLVYLPDEDKDLIVRSKETPFDPDAPAHMKVLFRQEGFETDFRRRLIHGFERFCNAGEDGTMEKWIVSEMQMALEHMHKDGYDKKFPDEYAELGALTDQLSKADDAERKIDGIRDLVNKAPAEFCFGLGKAAWNVPARVTLMDYVRHYPGFDEGPGAMDAVKGSNMSNYRKCVVRPEFVDKHRDKFSAFADVEDMQIFTAGQVDRASCQEDNVGRQFLTKKLADVTAQLDGTDTPRRDAATLEAVKRRVSSALEGAEQARDARLDDIQREMADQKPAINMKAAAHGM